MTAHVTTNLTSILANIQGQKTNIEANLAAATAASLAVDAEAQNAIDILLARYGDVQVIGKIIGAQLALGQLKAASHEVAVLEASLKAALDDSNFVARVVQQMSADTIREAANS